MNYVDGFVIAVPASDKQGYIDRSSTSYAPMQSDHCSWNELVTTDQKGALEFYSALFGWEKAGVMPMGEMGDYTFVKSGDTRLGAMMDAPGKGTTPFWNFAFTVPESAAVMFSAERRNPGEKP